MFGQGHATIPKNGIGEIALQLKDKLQQTTFQFKSKVQKVDGQQITLENGEIINHEGVIIATDASPLIENLRDQSTNWKSCHCLYFEVDKTNIPSHTIALMTKGETCANNLYAYKDESTDKTVLSVTVVKEFDGSQEELVHTLQKEIEEFCETGNTRFIHSFQIKQAPA
jgi:hypothetical protein